tara:strand:- start:190 stop:603 length:414 start_codon:yes stop_codon:yes gene_type:complete
LGKILALDFGAKRTGVAITDKLQIIASGLTTVETKKLQEFIIELLGKEEVETIVVGQAKRMNNELSQIEEQIVPFINFLKKRFPNIALEREDERLSSHQAVQAMVAGGMKKQKRRDKSMIDQISATIILQRFMERKA